MRDIGVGIIGTGFMGKAHAFAYRAAAGIFPLELRPVLEMVADNNIEAGNRAHRQLGFKRVTADWKELVHDPAVGIVSITTPNVVHREMALAAIAAGKPVHCEKPIAPNAEDARAMMEAAEAKGVPTQIGYNYIKNPLLGLARDMIAGGELGEIIGFRGIHAEDYMADPELAYNWRVDPSGGAGAIADIGSHIIGMARFLLGPITEVIADLETVVTSRPVAPGASERRDGPRRRHCAAHRPLRARLPRLDRGQLGGDGPQDESRLRGLRHQGRSRLHPGALQRASLLQGGRRPPASGFTRIEAGPAHDPYGLFCVAPGHQLGFNDLKTIEVADFLNAIAGGKAKGPDFREAWEIQKVIDTAIRSSKQKSWLHVP